MKFAVRLFFFLVFAGAPAFTRAGSDLKILSPATLVPTEWADGDSFLVRFSDPDSGVVREEVFRLYAVDCMETLSDRESDRRRLLEQARHFGVEKPGTLINEGRTATEFVKETLSGPFVIHTTFAQAEGRSEKQRYYGFVITADGKDLAAELVTRGLARVKGISRETADGASRDEYQAHLADLELAAAMERTGIWKLSNPARLAQFRAEKRSEDRALAAIQESPVESQPIDLNAATAREIESLPGIGKELASRILQGRPYQSPDDLLRVKGIGKTTLEKLRRFLQVEPGEASHEKSAPVTT